MTIAEQRAAALDAANKIRVDRAKLRLRMKAREVSATQVLADWPACIHGCGVYTFLTFLPNVGKRVGDAHGSRAFVLLRKASAPGHKRLDQLTPNQFERLARVVRDYEASRHPAEKGWA